MHITFEDRLRQVEMQMEAIKLRHQMLENILEQNKRRIPEAEQLQLACQKFGFPLKAIPRKRDTHGLSVSRHSVIRELFLNHGWPIEKICQSMHRSRWQVMRVIRGN